MPLIHSKTPKAFKENIRKEIHAGKPQKQAVAIAYSVKDKAEHHKAGGGCVGAECKGCSSANCMAEGGAVDSWTKREDNERGINRESGRQGVSQAGMHIKHGEKDSDSIDAAKRNHLKTLGEMRSMPEPNLMAEGGEVHEDAAKDHEMIDHELHDMMGEELMSAIDAKDKKRIMESLETIVLQCMNKE